MLLEQMTKVAHFSAVRAQHHSHIPTNTPINMYVCIVRVAKFAVSLFLLACANTLNERL